MYMYCKLIIKTTAAYVHTHEKFRLCFYVLVHYFVFLNIHLWKLHVHTGSVNIIHLMYGPKGNS